MLTQSPFKGIVLACVAVMIFASFDSLSKYLANSHGIIMLLWVRYLSQAALLAGWVVPRYGLGVLQINCPKLQFLRGLSLLGISIFFIIALSRLPLAEATAVHFIAPLLVVVLAPLILGEAFSAKNLIPVLIGFVGVLIIVRPGGGLLTPDMLFPLASATCFALYQLITRLIGTQDGAATTNLMSGLVGTLGMTLILPWFWEGWPPMQELLAMATLGVLAVVGHTLLTLAFQYSSPVLLAPFSYLQIMFAVIWSALLFDHIPDWGALLGMSVVMCSGFLSAWLQGRARHAADLS